MNQHRYYQPLELSAWQLRNQHLNHQTKLMIISEPFVDRAEQLLTAMIESMGYDRSEVDIVHVSEYRPPETCNSFLERQIALVNPALLLAIGDIAAHYLLNTKQSLESLRGKIHTFGEQATPLIVTYHPAYLLRSPEDKKKAYQDLMFAKKTLATQL